MIEVAKLDNVAPGLRIATKAMRVLSVAGLSLALLMPGGGPARAQSDRRDHHKTPAQGATGSAFLDQVSIPDVKLLNQHGQQVRFYSDLVKDRVVGLSFIYTSCTTICPPIGANVARLEKVLEKQSPNNNVQIISISIDPYTDTPERLKAWSEKFAPGPRWTLLTGPKTEVDHLLKTLKVFSASIEDHAPFFLIGNEPRGRWTLVNGLAAPTELADMLEDLAALADPAAAPAHHGQDGS